MDAPETQDIVSANTRQPPRSHRSLHQRFEAVLAAAFGQMINAIRIIVSDKLGMVGLVFLTIMIFVAVFADFVAPYPPFETQYFPDGRVARLVPPSQYFWLGTNNTGQDIFSQLVLGTRLAFLIGLSAAVVSVIIGVNVGLFSGYFGGKIDQILMRLTDVAYGIPMIPFALMFVFLAGPTLFNIILVISLFIWRPKARVIRSQVMKLKELPFTTAARASGASDLRIMYVHIAPNILPFAFLYLALSVGEAVLLEASLSFLGFGDPLQPTWGLMLNSAFQAGAVRYAWWWALPPGFALTIFVSSIYLVTRAFEEIVNPRLRVEV